MWLGLIMVISDTFIPIVLKMCTLEADETQSIKDECNSGESDTISVLSNDSEVSTQSLDVEIEPIQIAEFEPIDQYNMPIEETDQTYTLPLLK